MKVVVCKDYDEMSKKIAEEFIDAIKENPSMVLGLATGSTPEGLYKNLVEAYEAGKVDFSKVTSVNLDEYKGASPDDEYGYRYFMNQHLFDHVNIDKSKTFVPNGLAQDSEKVCEEYEELIKKLGGIDLQILGIGANGHIGFNEPGDHFVKNTHCVDLTESTRKANARFFDSIDDVPTQAYSMGIGTIMSAKKIILAVSGQAKAQAWFDTYYGDITPKVQASILQLHDNVVAYVVEDALQVAKQKGCL